MERSQISRTLRQEAAISRVAAILSRESFDSRSALGRRVCAEFGFPDARGRPRLAGCMKAPGVLAERVPGIALPPPKAPAARAGPRLLDAGVPEPEGVPAHPSLVAGLRVAPVAARGDRAVWNTLMAREHPHGMTTFAGHQVRYLVGSDHGWPGAAGFSAAALRVAAWDRWIGWDDAARRARLDRVTCLNRFLVRPSVRCPHLASHVLGRVLRRLPGDFEARYGFRPWLVGSFADEGYEGICLRAAGFLCVGRTEGRGRQDRGKLRAATVKTVLMRPPERSWRRRLGVPFVDHAPSLEPGEGPGAESRAENGSGGAPLGDRRLSARLAKSAGLLAAHPGRKINASSDSGTGEIAGFHRLVEASAGSEVTVPNILAPHRGRTVRRIRGQRTVLAVQDGTDLNFARRPGCDGLETVGRNRATSSTLGLHMHATLAVTDTGLPLGLLKLGFDPQAKDAGKAEKAKEAERRRRTERWLEGFDDTADAARGVGGRTRVVSVCDREGDIFELFDRRRRRPRVDLLVRAQHDRSLGGGGPKLFAAMSGGAPDGMVDVEIRALTARPKDRRPARTGRLAACELRFRRVTLPATETFPDADPVTVNAVHIRETAPPEGEEPVQWRLLTTLGVGSAEDAAGVVGLYLQRWRVEDFFRVLKSGCRVEFLLFRTAERLRRAIAINAVIAWRIMTMTLLGRQVPDCDPRLMFTDTELAFLRDYASRYGLKAPERLGDARAPGRASRRMPAPEGRPGAREPGHVARPDAPDQRLAGPRDRLPGRPETRAARTGIAHCHADLCILGRSRPPAVHITAGLASLVSGVPSACLPATSSPRIAMPVPSMERYMRGSGGARHLLPPGPSRPPAPAPGPAAGVPRRRTGSGNARAAPQPGRGKDFGAALDPVTGEPAVMRAHQRRMHGHPVLRQALQIRHRVRRPTHIAAVASRHGPRSFGCPGQCAGRFARFWSHAPASESADEKRGCQKIGIHPSTGSPRSARETRRRRSFWRPTAGTGRWRTPTTAQCPRSGASGPSGDAFSAPGEVIR